MTTKRTAFSGVNTSNNQAAQSRSAAKRQCPKCGRKSAIVQRPAPGVVRGCRWPQCGYAVLDEDPSLPQSDGEVLR